MSRRVIIDCPEDFSLIGTLLSGQCFRWSSDAPDTVCGTAQNRAVTIRREGSTVVIDGDGSPDACTFWRNYLDFDTDYAAIRAQAVAAEPRLKAAAERCGGVYILRQHPWEALCSFVISQNNNIPRIRTIIRRLCERYGEQLVGADGSVQWAFPLPEIIAGASEDELKALGCGYRAAYLPAAARAAIDGSFDPKALRTMPISEARAALQTIHGVGPKVADCVLLYGLHRLDAFPRDVWIKRALEGEFRDTPLQYSSHAGVAQQYIFEYIRTGGTEGH